MLLSRTAPIIAAAACQAAYNMFQSTLRCQLQAVAVAPRELHRRERVIGTTRIDWTDGVDNVFPEAHTRNPLSFLFPVEHLSIFPCKR
jgi:hypothetical protein